jgi:hypothetical protein
MIDGEDDASVDDLGIMRRRDVVWSALWNENEVSVRHPISVDDHADALRLEDIPHTASDVLGHNHNACRNVVGDISEVIDVLSRDHRTLTCREGPECHEGHDGLVLVDDAGRATAIHDITEGATHIVVALGKRLDDEPPLSCANGPDVAKLRVVRES